MIYRKEIDGLRAVAVVPVILFHAGINYFSGGFVGVDVFFVISGYLITTILIEEMGKGDFDLLKFYERRSRRILPALFFVMLCCIPCAWLWMLPVKLENFSQSMVAVSLFFSNFYFFDEADYFAPTSDLEPLLHTWSLAVEEQYYLVFPPLLFFLWRYGTGRVIWTLIGLALASFFYAQWASIYDPERNFFWPTGRVWELFAGSLAAFFINSRGVLNNNILSLAGLGAIVASILMFDRTTPFPSAYTLLPVGGAFLIICFGGKGTIVARILSLRLLVGIGLISYSAYLWHQPIFAFAHFRSPKEPTLEMMLVLSLFSLVLAVFSWKFIEQPFRKGGVFKLSQKHIFTYSMIGIISFVVVGTIGRHFDGFENRLSQNAQVILKFKKDRNPYTKGACSFNEKSELKSHPIEGCTEFFVNGKAQVMFLGDSHAHSFSFQTQKLLKQQGIGSYSINFNGCIGLPGFYGVNFKSKRKCDAHNRAMIEYAKKTGITTIVIASRFPMYYYGVPYDNGEGGVEASVLVTINTIEDMGKDEASDSESRKNRVKARLKLELEQLAQDFEIVLVHPIPEVGWHVPKHIAKLSLISGETNTISLDTSYARYIERTAEISKLFDSLVNPKITHIYPDKIFCNRQKAGRCDATTKEGLPLYFDDDHLANSTGAIWLADKVMEEMLESQHYFMSRIAQ